jgi:hypothetical protein
VTERGGGTDGVQGLSGPVLACPVLSLGASETAPSAICFRSRCTLPSTFLDCLSTTVALLPCCPAALLLLCCPLLSFSPSPALLLSCSPHRPRVLRRA